MNTDIIPVVFRKVKGEVLCIFANMWLSRITKVLSGFNGKGEEVNVWMDDYKKGKPCTEEEIQPVAALVSRHYGCFLKRMRRLRMK